MLISTDVVVVLDGVLVLAWALYRISMQIVFDTQQSETATTLTELSIPPPKVWNNNYCSARLATHTQCVSVGLIDLCDTGQSSSFPPPELSADNEESVVSQTKRGRVSLCCSRLVFVLRPHSPGRIRFDE